MGILTRTTLFLLCIMIEVNGEQSEEVQVNEFVLHPDRVDAFYYRAAMMALLKAKSKVLSKQVDLADRIIYKECQREAQNIVQQAKCLIKLMDVRDRRKSESTTPVKSSKFSVFEFESTNEDNPLKVLLKAIVDTKWKSLGELLNSPQKKLAAELKTPIKLRRKRSTASYIEKEKDFNLPLSIRNLRKIERYLRRADYVRNYMNELNERNERQFDRMNFPTEFKAQPPTPNSAFETIQNFISGAPFDRLSILSPRLMSLFPSRGSDDEGPPRPKLLSPDLLSIHDQGVFPLPNVLRMALGNEREVHAWVDLLLKLTGATKQLDRMLKTMRDEMKQVDEHLYPKTLELQERDEQWRAFEAQISAAKRRELDRNGYTYLEAEEANVLFDTFPEHVHYTSKQKEFLLEQRIRELGQLDERLLKQKILFDSKKRSRRQIQLPGVTPPPNFNELKAMLGLPTDLGESPDAESNGEPKVVVLEPWANEHRIGGFVILEGIVLSPHAITAELFSPEFMTFHALSPRAIMAFITEILSPKVLEARVLSPKAIGLVVLSPSVGAPKVQSGEALMIVVLSPPHIMSDGMLNVEILSPHLLSGDDEHHSNHTHQHCCNATMRHCCSKKELEKHDSHSHFNQFIHSSTQRHGQKPPTMKKPSNTQ
ncbi:Moulting cycle MLT-10-like protein family-containing protein [Aphelenchoides besseyi]|nr:Moulting cycle MLT-10-like protein family-containing protein [Aphelenchoides besseyi]